MFLHGRDEPVPVELDPQERQGLDMSDDEVHNRLPAALARWHAENRDEMLHEMLPQEQYRNVSYDRPVRLLQNHFV